jgi:hypothetical protein
MKLLLENWREYIKEADDFDWDAFGFSDEERGDAAATSPDPHYEDLIELDRGDTFTIGNRKPVYRVIGAPAESGKTKGSQIKTVVIHGSAERKYYIVKGVSEDYAVGAFEAVGGGTDTVDEPYNDKTGFVMNITKASKDK